MNIITDRPIYSNVEGEAKMKPLAATQLPSSMAMPDKLSSGATAPKNKKPLGGLFAKKDKTETTATKGGGGLFQKKDTKKSDKDLVALAERIKTMSQAEVEALLKTLTKFEIAEIKRIQRKENRQIRKASRTAKRLLRAKDKNGKKRWFYPINRVFNGKKVNKDGTVEAVAASDIVTTSNGAQFDKKEIAAAAGVSTAQVTSQMVEQTAVSSNPNQTVTEETKLSPMVARPNEPAANTDPSADPVNKMTTIYYPVSDNKQVTQTSDGATYLSEETIPMEEAEVDEDVNMRKKDAKADDKKGLGVWGWVGISAIVVGLGVAGVLLYKMSASKK
jgi:hypothetical protein